LFLGVLALAHLGAGRNAEAEAEARQSVQEHPKSIPAHRTLARAAAARLLEIKPSARISNMLNPMRKPSFPDGLLQVTQLADGNAQPGQEVVLPWDRTGLAAGLARTRPGRPASPST
jgi:hypothetical protein